MTAVDRAISQSLYFFKRARYYDSLCDPGMAKAMREIARAWAEAAERTAYQDTDALPDEVGSCVFRRREM